MKALILSKTHMKEGRCCVGALANNGRYLRLLTSDGENQKDNTEFSVRQIYEIAFTERENNIPPHVEDVLVQKQKFISDLGEEETILDYIRAKAIPVWEGDPDVLFDGKIQWTANGSGFINHDDVPNHSVGFWISDRDLHYSLYYNKHRYSYHNALGWKSIPYVGFEEPIKMIPQGTLIRVSLARWWDTKGTTEDRCSLQLSGWYDL